MSGSVDDLQKRARRKLKRLERKRSDARYRAVMGRLIAAGVLTSTEDVAPHREKIRVADALWAGEVEPRILELLPALLVKRPGLFEDPVDQPDDLEQAVAALKRNREPADFRGIDGAALLRWVPLVGRRHKLPSQLKSFRMTVADVQLMTRLGESLGLSNTDVIRSGLRALAARELLD